MSKVSNLKKIQIVHEAPQQDGVHAAIKMNKKKVADEMFGERTGEIYTISKSTEDDNVSVIIQ